MEYKISRASHPGILHTADTIQDRVSVLKKDSVCCAALADGAGSRSRSGLGALEVTRTVCRRLCADFDELWGHSQQENAQDICQSCLEDLKQLKIPLSELASTLLFFAAHRDGRFIAGHLGDGVQILVQQNEVRVFSYPENGEQYNETWFVTSSNAAEHLRIRKGNLEHPGTLLLMSDGMGQSLYQRSAGQPAPACQVMADWQQSYPEEFVEQILRKNMEKIFSQRSSDDLSLVMIGWQEQNDISSDGFTAEE